jgi:hypothetical protein
MLERNDYERINSIFGEAVADDLVYKGVLDQPVNTTFGRNLALEQDPKLWNRNLRDANGINAGRLKIHFVLSNSNYNNAEKGVIRNALADLESITGGLFMFVENAVVPYINVVNGNYCGSFVGRTSGNSQDVTLNGSGCLFRGTIQHEFLHALGFWHEHSRNDRNDYVGKRAYFRNVNLLRILRITII